MKPTTKIILGLLLMIFSIIYLFKVVLNRNNDYFWETKKFVVVEKMGGYHSYKGDVVPDYYIRYYYTDNPSVRWIRKLNGLEFHTYELNSTYVERDIKDRPLFMFYLGFMGILMIGGFIFVISNILE